jgi:hypothetical protein
MPSRFVGRKRAPIAILLAALRAAQSRYDVLEPRVPAAEPRQRMGFCMALVAARALEHQRVLSELIAQFLNAKLARHAPLLRPGQATSIQFLTEASTV